MKRQMRMVALAAAVALPLAACGSGGSGNNDDPSAASDLTKGPINIWYSNNEQEVRWGESVVEAWNDEHPDEQISAEEIPAGNSSEDVISAAITAGTTPCLVYNTAPAGVAAFQKQGGLVNLSTTFEDGESYLTGRSGDGADGFRSPDGDLYQLPWKTNPFMLYYNKTLFAEAGLDPENPILATYDDVLAAGKALTTEGGAEFALYPPSTSEYTNALFDFYPLFLANSGGTQLVSDGEAKFTSDEAYETLEFWKTVYADGLSSPEAYPGDMWAGPFAEGVAAMGVAGPWGAAQFEGKVDFGVVPLPTASGKSADEIYTFGDSKNVGMYSSCDNLQTAWDFLKFSTNDDNDLALLEQTGQFPTRTDVTDLAADYLTENPFFDDFAQAVPRAVDVPNVDSGAEIWQTFRDAWGKSVQGDADLKQTMDEAAQQVNDLLRK